jgi:hypothetical protein
MGKPGLLAHAFELIDATDLLVASDGTLKLRLDGFARVNSGTTMNRTRNV